MPEERRGGFLGSWARAQRPVCLPSSRVLCPGLPVMEATLRHLSSCPAGPLWEPGHWERLPCAPAPERGFGQPRVEQSGDLN